MSELTAIATWTSDTDLLNYTSNRRLHSHINLDLFHTNRSIRHEIRPDFEKWLEAGIQALLAWTIQVNNMTAALTRAIMAYRISDEGLNAVWLTHYRRRDSIYALYAYLRRQKGANIMGGE